MSEFPQITVLIVDDEMSIRRLLEFYLKKFFTVGTAADGLKAKEWIEAANRPDIVIADLNMPLMNGLELTRFIRSKPELDNVPVIILSGSEDESEKLKCIQAGASDYIIKPFRPEELHTLITSRLKSSGKL